MIHRTSSSLRAFPASAVAAVGKCEGSAGPVGVATPRPISAGAFRAHARCTRAITIGGADAAGWLRELRLRKESPGFGGGEPAAAAEEEETNMPISSTISSRWTVTWLRPSLLAQATTRWRFAGPSSALKSSGRSPRSMASLKETLRGR